MRNEEYFIYWEDPDFVAPSQVRPEFQMVTPNPNYKSEKELLTEISKKLDNIIKLLQARIGESKSEAGEIIGKSESEATGKGRRAP